MKIIAFRRIHYLQKKFISVRLPLQSATPPHWVISPMAVRAIPASTRRRTTRRLQNRIQIMFRRAATFYSTIGIGWHKDA